MVSKRGFAALFTFLLLICILPPPTVRAYETSQVQECLDGIVGYKLQESGSSDVQAWINGRLSERAGIDAEWYILTISQSSVSVSFKSYEKALLTYLNANGTASAVTRQKYALALISVGSTDSYITETLQDSIGMQGVMSWIYGLHLMNNGYTSDKYTLEDVKKQLLSMQLSDGGWAVMGSNADVDVTAMAVQALAPQYNGGDASVQASVNKALELLSSRQLEDGDFSSYGTPNPESTAQVMTALAALGIDGASDSRFIKNGCTLLDGLKKYRLSDGSFCHQLGAASNDTATVQAYYALVAVQRAANAQSPLYVLDQRNHEEQQQQSTTVQQPDAEINEKSDHTETTLLPDMILATDVAAETVISESVSDSASEPSEEDAATDVTAESLASVQEMIHDSEAVATEEAWILADETESTELSVTSADSTPLLAVRWVALLAVISITGVIIILRLYLKSQFHKPE